MGIVFWLLLIILVTYTWVRILGMVVEADRRRKVARKFDDIVKGFKGDEPRAR